MHYCQQGKVNPNTYVVTCKKCTRSIPAGTQEFPNLTGGHSSVIYFRDIAKRNESRFIEDYNNQTVAALKADVLGQVRCKLGGRQTKSGSDVKLRFACIALEAFAQAENQLVQLALAELQSNHYQREVR